MHLVSRLNLSPGLSQYSVTSTYQNFPHNHFHLHHHNDDHDDQNDHVDQAHWKDERWGDKEQAEEVASLNFSKSGDYHCWYIIIIMMLMKVMLTKKVKVTKPQLNLFLQKESKSLRWPCTKWNVYKRAENASIYELDKNEFKRKWKIDVYRNRLPLGIDPRSPRNHFRR